MGGQYLVRLLKGGVRHAALPPVKEYDYGSKKHLLPADRWKHARRWIHSISEWIQGVLGNDIRITRRWELHCPGNIYNRDCIYASVVQHWYNYAMYICCGYKWADSIVKCLRRYDKGNINTDKSLCDIFHHRLLTLQGGDGYAAI